MPGRRARARLLSLAMIAILAAPAPPIARASTPGAGATTVASTSETRFRPPDARTDPATPPAGPTWYGRLSITGEDTNPTEAFLDLDTHAQDTLAWQMLVKSVHVVPNADLSLTLTLETTG